jgi:pyruvate-formate lyase
MDRVRTRIDTTVRLSVQPFLLGVSRDWGGMQKLTKDAGHWSKRAEEMRALAEETEDAQMRRKLLEIAEGYDLLVQRAAARLDRWPGS